MSFWRSTLVKSTRKPHQCVLCTRTINTGSEAEYNAGIWEGDMQSYYLCIRCLRFIDTFKDIFDMSEGFTSDDFYETIYDYDKQAICPECGSGNHKDREWTNDKMECSFECDNCGHKWTGDFSFGTAKEKTGGVDNEGL